MTATHAWRIVLCLYRVSSGWTAWGCYGSSRRIILANHSTGDQSIQNVARNIEMGMYNSRVESWRSSQMVLSPDPPRQFRTFGFPEYGLPIIFIRMPSHFVPKEPWLELRTGPRNHNSTCPDTPCTQNYGSGVSAADIFSSCRPSIF